MSTNGGTRGGGSRGRTRRPQRPETTTCSLLFDSELRGMQDKKINKW